MAKYYQEVKRFVESKYPEFRGNIEGANYPPSDMAQFLAQLANWLWIGGIGLLMAGGMLFDKMGISEPWWYKWMTENKMACFFGLFIINSMGAKLLTTGAFEVVLSQAGAADLVLFSRLTNGGVMPTGDDIMRGLDAAGFIMDTT